MSLRVILLILVIVSGLGLFGYALVANNAPPPQPQQAAAPKPVQEAMAVVAGAEITTGSLIPAQSLKFAPPPAGTSHELEFMRVYAANENDQTAADRRVLDEIAGGVARRRFSAGEPILRGEVVKPGDSGFLAAVLQPGMRAITIGVTAVSGTAGLIYPGDRVDVTLTQTFNNPDISVGRRSVAETVASDLRVLAIDQQLQGKASPSGEGKLAQTVTLEVQPRQVDEINVASKLGDLSLTIRSLQANKDAAPKPETPIWADDVSSAIKQAMPARAPGQPVKALVNITVMRGDKSEQINR